ncbi:MAG: hypothetical protein J6K61_03635 [Clostridia bacterium]|nr:hypothetical protein [Clostridia bacterium]
MRDLTKGNIYKTFLVFALPLVFSGVLSQMYGIVDSVIAGQYLGEVGLAATGVSAPFITFISSFIWGYSSGVSISAGRLFGAKDYGRLKNMVLTQCCIIVAASLLLGGLSILLHKPIFRLIQVDAAIWEESFRYFAVYMAGFFLIVMNVVFIHLSSALGASMVPFVLSLVSGLLNVAGNILSVAVLDMGVLGISLATVVSAAVTFLAYVVYFIREFRKLPTEEKARISFADCKWVLSFSLPTSLQQATMYFATMALSPMVNALGPSATASYTVTNRIFEFNSTVFYNSSRALGSYVPQCIGAKKYTSIKKGFWVACCNLCFFCFRFLLPPCCFPSR